MNKSIVIQNLSFKYPGQNQTTIKINHLEIYEGEKVFLYGPSGTGKTTFLELLAGILSPGSGEIYYFEKSFNSLTQSEKDLYRAQNMGYIFQNFNLIPYLTVKENLQLSIQFAKKVWDEKLYNSILNELNIYEISNKKTSEISQGQAQRAAVARSLLKKPKIILADEPTSALDQDNKENYLNLLFKLCLQEKITLLFVSHDRTLESLFDRKISILELQN